MSPQDYWKANLKLLAVLLFIWFVISFGFGIVLSDFLDQFSLGGFKLGFWFAQQGSIYGFVILIFVYVFAMHRLEKKINKNKENNYSERIKNSFNSKNNYKSWNNNWETIRLLIIFSFLIIGFAFIYTQIDSVLEILTNSQSK